MKILSGSRNYGVEKLGFENIKENQQQAIEAYLTGRDVLMVSPTGSGKSLTFHIVPFVYSYLKRGRGEKNIESICLVVVPLLSLMRDQVARLQQRGITAICLGVDTTPEQLLDISKPKYNLLFGTTESILKTHRNVLRGELKDKIDIIFVDESHR